MRSRKNEQDHRNIQHSPRKVAASAPEGTSTTSCRRFGESGTLSSAAQVQPDVMPKFCKSRPVPFTIWEAVGKELDHLEEQGIIEKVTHNDWAAVIIPAPKKDGRFRLCGDYIVTINQALSVEQYPLPKPEDLFATLAGGQAFSKLDLSQAYLQVQLDEQSKDYLTLNTHQGLYRYVRFPFGVTSAPALFQKMMDTVLQGIPRVIYYIDDILITGKDEQRQQLKHVRLRRKQTMIGILNFAVLPPKLSSMCTQATKLPDEDFG